MSLVVLVHFLLGVKIHSEESDDDDGGLGYKSTTQRPVSTEMTPGNFKFQINCEAHFGAEEMDSQLLLASLSLLHSTSASVHCFSPPVDDGRRARCAERTPESPHKCLIQKFPNFAIFIRMKFGGLYPFFGSILSGGPALSALWLWPQKNCGRLKFFFPALRALSEVLECTTYRVSM